VFPPPFDKKVNANENKMAILGEYVKIGTGRCSRKEIDQGKLQWEGGVGAGRSRSFVTPRQAVKKLKWEGRSMGKGFRAEDRSGRCMLLALAFTSIGTANAWVPDRPGRVIVSGGSRRRRRCHGRFISPLVSKYNLSPKRGSSSTNPPAPGRKASCT